MTKHRRKSWASWFPIARPQAWPATDYPITHSEQVFVIGEGNGWPTDIAANRKLWGMKP